MTPDPIDELGARLFDAARREPPPAGAAERAIQAARRGAAASRRSAGTGRWWIALVPLAAGLGAVTLWLTRPVEPISPISAEPSAALPSEQNEPAHQPAATGSAPLSAEPSPGSKALLPAASAPMTLADELETLKRAQSALDAGDARRALTTLDRYDRAAKGQRLRAEATVLRIEALSRAGQHGAAAALARRFVDQNPESPLVDRARSFIAKDPSAAGGQPGKEE